MIDTSLVLDTIAATWWGRFSSVTVGERIPAGPPKRLHDPAYVRAQARQHLQFVMPGETTYQLIPDPRPARPALPFRVPLRFRQSACSATRSKFMVSNASPAVFDRWL